MSRFYSWDSWSWRVTKSEHRPKNGFKLYTSIFNGRITWLGWLLLLLLLFIILPVSLLLMSADPFAVGRTLSRLPFTCWLFCRHSQTNSPTIIRIHAAWTENTLKDEARHIQAYKPNVGRIQCCCHNKNVDNFHVRHDNSYTNSHLLKQLRSTEPNLTIQVLMQKRTAWWNKNKKIKTKHKKRDDNQLAYK